MTQLPLQLSVKKRIKKYAAGADPQKDQPIEIEEREHILEGTEAEQYLLGMGIDPRRNINVTD